MNNNTLYIRRCLELAKNGLGSTYPNPLVGAVIVHNETIIGEGWHQRAGEAHAEIIAINAVKNPDLLKQSTLFVSLEPCSHFGKTPPCADAIIKHQIPRVVIATQDPHNLVVGMGIERLRDANIEVTINVLEAEAQHLNRRFFTYHNKKRPYIILKWAQTQDGFTAPLHKQGNRPFWISDAYSRLITHKWRTEEQAIMVGTNTVLDDNPHLNVRDWTGENPTRIVLDRSLRIPSYYNIYDQNTKTIILTQKNINFQKQNIIFELIDENISLTQNVCNILYKHHIQSVIIEGGKQLLDTFIEDNLWDEARVFVSPTHLEQGIKAPVITTATFSKKALYNDILYTYTNYEQY